VTGWCEDKRSAAQSGPVSAEILRMLCRVEAHLVYKVDRSARNLKDWGGFREFIDRLG